MNAVHAVASPLYRPQLGVGGGAGIQQLPTGSSSSLNERDDSRNNSGGRNQGYADPVTSPLSPTGGSDFSFSKYQSDTYMQQRGDNNTGFPPSTTDSSMPNSGGTNSLMGDRSSSGSARDPVVIEHYAALRKYLTRQLAAEGIPL
jgi:hypothetical protein